MRVNFQEIEQAAQRLRGFAHKTPVQMSRTINRKTGCEVYFKCENFQRTGSFKFRGAFNALAALSEEAREKGVLTYSSGNHAQALASAGQILGIPVTVIMPSDAPLVKIEATRGYGAEVIAYDRSEHTREAWAKNLQEETGRTLIPPFDHPHVIAGQGTATRELIEEVRLLDVLIVCTGGGGLLSGSALAAKTMNPQCRVVGIEPAAGDDVTRSFQTGTIQSVHNPNTIADGARTHAPSALTFGLIQAYVDDMRVVSDEALARTMFFMWERLKLVVEPTGALATAGLFHAEVVRPGQRIGVIISGGNVALQDIPHLWKVAGYALSGA
ncbi:MAG TPA: threo-3-hydroxy-L-aspartate ammonia-lyase [Bacteroidetes bacterium]|nr:threo-3-hydroxy-L-aspartate ammonia-lyase [Bacteroidota bacterium]